MARHYIGATSLIDGKATFPYLCRGSGELQIKASVREGSETLFEDKGVTGSKNVKWYTNSYGTKSVTDSGTTITSNGSTTNYLMYSASDVEETANHIYLWSPPSIIEFDIVSVTTTSNDAQFQIYSDEISQSFVFNINRIGHYKIIFDSSSRTAYCDNELISPSVDGSGAFPNSRITFRVKNSATITFRNFIIYSLGGGEETISTPTPILDCTVYDDMETTQYETKYKRDNTANISYSTEWAVSGTKSIKWDLSSAPSGNASYWGFVFITNPTTSAFDIELIKGKTLQLETDTKTTPTTSSNSFTIVAYVKTSTNTNWSQIGAYVVPSGEAHNKTAPSGQNLTYEIPSNAIQFWVRFGSVGSSPKTLYVDNWKLYPI